MNFENLDKLPDQAKKVLEPFLSEIYDVFGQEIISIFVYGSITGSDYNPRRSDINAAIVTKEFPFESLKPILKTVRNGIKHKISAPLFLTPAYIKMSLDTFPMEFMSMKDSRRVLYGEDVLENVEVKAEDLRRECEYQIKGKIITIRQAYLEQGLRARGIEKLIKASFRALIPVFYAILRIKLSQVPPRGKEEILCQLSEECGVDVASFLEVLRDKKNDGCIAGKEAEVFLKDFLFQLGTLADMVDKM
ncbi:MAG: hypothetical protein ABH869_06595 [Candidatus Omnitrophota bacterium]